MLPDFRLHHQEYVNEILRAILQELDLERLLARLLEATVTILAGRAGVIVLREADGWTVAAVYGLPVSLIRHLESLIADVPQHPVDPMRFEVPQVTRRLEWLMQVSHLGLQQGVGIPLVAREELLGLIYVYRNYPSLFTQDDLVSLQLFADQAAIAVHNARLYTQLRQEKQRLDALLDAVADGILILNPGLLIERVNPAFAQMYAAGADQVLGRRHREVVRWRHVERGEPLEDALARGWPTAAGDALYVQGDMYRADGTTLPVGITYAPLFDEEGDLLNIIASARDIRAFREADRLKATFISTISHELKTPIALIKGYVSTLRRPDVRWDSSIVQEALAVIEEEADRLSRLVQDLLEASRIQAGALRLEFQEVDLRALVQRMAQRFRHQHPEFTFEVDVPEDLPPVWGDEGRLEQVLTNLLHNAVKYAPKGTVVRLEVRPGERELTVCVRDQGPGIAPEDQPHVFDPFYRSHRHADSHPGTGLGLYLSRVIVEAHGGRIWVDPHYREGARLCFTLPLMDRRDRESHQGTSHNARTTHTA